MKVTDNLLVACWEDQQVSFLARIKNNLGSYITQASLTSISCRVFDLSTKILVSSPTVTISSTVYNTLQTSSNDPRWTLDSTGFNFLHVVPGAAFPTGDRRYRVQYTFTPVSGDPFPLVAEVSVRSLLPG